jgi:uncharacterized protein with PIN domain
LSVCLDSWAVLAWLDGEQPAVGRVDAQVLRSPVISWINAVEVYYRVERDHGRPEADALLSDLRGVLDVEVPGVGRMVEAARVKAEHPIALGDCFAIATASARGVPLWTGDPEIVERSASLRCEVVDLRAG